jgi:hypothetical protein
VSRRVTTPLLVLLAVLAGCSTGRTFELTVDGEPVDDADVTSSAVIQPGSVGTTLDVRIGDPGPPGVADAGISFVFRIVLAAGVTAGDVLDASGQATLITELGRGSTPSGFTFAADDTSDGRLAGVFAWAECFCGTAGTFDQTVDAHLEILDTSATSITFWIEADVSGRIPGRDFVDAHHVLRGRFTANRPTR